MASEKFECQSVSIPGMAAPSPTNLTDYSKHRGVRHTKSGKWGAAIRHPITKVSVWLGSFKTPEEAADAYTKKKLEYQSLSVHDMEASIPANAADFGKHLDVKRKKNSGKRGTKFQHCADVEKHSAQAVRNIDASNCAKRLPGTGSVYRSKAGRWLAYVSVNKTRVRVGSYATREEAEAALDSKRQELASRDNTVGCNTTGKQFLGLSESMNGQLTCKRPSGVYQRESGRWYAEPQNPITRVRCCVGTYDTAEEALEALNEKRREFASMVYAERQHKQMKQSNDVMKHESRLASTSEDIICEAKRTKVTVADRDAHGESNMNVKSFLIPSLLPADTEEFDTCVINAYGQLVGEFSRLDDDLWLGGPLDDDDAHNI